MSTPAFDLTPLCPSEAVLDRFELGELPENGEPARHIRACPVCQARLQERAAAFSALERKDELVRAIHVALAEAGEQPPRKASWRLPHWAWGLGVASVAALALWVRPVPEASGVRSKGGAGLSVFVERAGGVVRVESGSTFVPGERLRFEVNLPTASEVMIVGREASGRVYAAFPVGGREAASQPLEGGPNQLLPGAVRLDDTLGQETLFLVVCRQPFTAGQVSFHRDRVRPTKGCSTSPFVMEKVAPSSGGP